MDQAPLGIASLYIGTFTAHADAYVRESRFTIKEPLTPEVVLAALGRGGFSVSGYLAHEHKTHVGAMDFDTDDGFNEAIAVRDTLKEQDIGSVLVGSRRGAHLWVLCSENLPAHVFRRALRNVGTMLDLDMDKVEVFPKRSQTALGVGALRLPLMKHPKTKVRYPYYDDGLAPQRKWQDLLLHAVDAEASPEALTALAGPEPEDIPYPAWNTRYGARSSSSKDGPSATEVLASVGATARPGGGLRCPFHDDQHASLQVSPDDERVWCKALSCDIHNEGRGMGSRDLAAYIRKDPPSA